MAEEVDTDKFYFEHEQLSEDADSEYRYEVVPVDDEYYQQEADEDLETIARSLQEATQDAKALEKKESVQKASIFQRPEVVDDFVRNFLIRMGMFHTLDCFQTEWYELHEKGSISFEDAAFVPDVYTRNQSLELELLRVQREADKFKSAAVKARESYVKLRKERDYHRMHHKRVVQEKNRLVTDIKRLKEHYSTFEPTLRELKHKYETAMKERLLTKLERDRVVSESQGLKGTLKSIENARANDTTNPSAISLNPLQRGSGSGIGRGGPTQRALAAERAKWDACDVKEMTEPRHPKDSKFPPDAGINPNLANVKAPAPHLLRSGGFKLGSTFHAHTHAVSSMALHPRKQVLATTSDDHTWKVWGLPTGELILTGRGHTDWVSGCDFHPSGVKLATVSGDKTVKVWDFAKAECVHTFADHQKAVWGCSWHTCGDFVASCSLDNTSKIWDLNSLRCRYTLRGHTDSVNSIQFLPFSNTLLTCSADKTISLWDARTGLCAQSFYGHLHSINSCTFNMRGETVASCDSFGTVKLWDIRSVNLMTSVDCGPHPANTVTFDPTGSVLAIASNDASIKMYEVANGKISSLCGHEDAVQCLAYDRAGEFVVSGSSDQTVRIWS